MVLRFLRGIVADLELSDEQYVKHEKARFVPLSINPFQEPGVMKVDEEPQREAETERPLGWLELVGDLAWAASFAQVTSNTAITSLVGIGNYAVFFALTWHLWATQTTYDIKYYTNDWWHRALFACQLAVYAILAAFSVSFNVGWEFSNDAMNPFVGNSTALTSQAIRQYELTSMQRSFKGVNIVLLFSRMLLCLQYLRVLWYRRQSKQFWSWRFFLPPASVFMAGCIFLSCFIMLNERGGSEFIAATQLTLWGLAIGIQVLAAAFTPEDDTIVLKSKNSLTPRLCTLTVIILGEGLSALCSTLGNTVNSLGLTLKMVLEALSMLLVLYFIWLLYFNGFINKKPSGSARTELWLWFHFPLHFSLILLLEGIKNMFIFVNIYEVLVAMAYDFIEIYQFHKNNGGHWPAHPRLEALLLPLKISWQQEFLDLGGPPPEGDFVSVWKQWAHLTRWHAGCIHKLYTLFNDEQNPEAELAYHNYLLKNDTATVDDYAGGGEEFYQFIREFNRKMSYSCYWILAVAGTYLICLAVLDVMQGRPQNWFAWGYPITRSAIGVTLIIIGHETGIMGGAVYWLGWLIPIIAIAYTVCGMVDWIILFLSIRSIGKKEKSVCDPLGCGSGGGADGDWVHGVCPQRMSEVLYVSVPLMQAGLTEASGSAGSTHTDLFDPYAEVGVSYDSLKHLQQGSGRSTELG